MHSLAMVQSTT
ncbi:hypothetical protein LINPERPRIM_LOCUS11507 [Linum perenne]